MYEQKTKPTSISVASYLNAIEDPERRRDCKTLSTLMQKVTGCKATMWGTSIVGFDKYSYTYASGHSGESCVVGFSSRKGDISVYLLGGYDSADAKALLAKLGKHKVGKACLYLKSLTGIDMTVLEALVTRAVRFTRERYGVSTG